MGSDRIAVIDLGSNTFHLLICEINEAGVFVPLFKERIYVKLASGGIDEIEPERIERGLMAMKRFAGYLKEYDIQVVRCIGTSALREAKNGAAVAMEFSKATGLTIEIIDGQQEAAYIYRGIRTAVPDFDRPGLIMDIGGGSVEFILYDGPSVRFKGSYKIGVAVLYQRFHHSDPMSVQEQEKLERFLDEELKELIQVVTQLMPYHLVGASGSFEVIHDVLPRLQDEKHWAEMDITDLEAYVTEVIGTDIAARRKIPEIPNERLDYIVVAYTLIRYIFRKIPPIRLFYCDFALKEGVLAEMMDHYKFRSL